MLGDVYKRQVRTRDTIRNHQTTTQQFFQPAGIMWAGFNKNYYVTTNENAEGTQRLVQSIVAPTLESTGVYTRITDIDYRGTRQTVWRINSDIYFDQLNLISNDLLNKNGIYKEINILLKRRNKLIRLKVKPTDINNLQNK